MTLKDTEPQQQRLKRTGKRWPKWLRSKYLIRWLIKYGPLIFRLVRIVILLIHAKDG